MAKTIMLAFISILLVVAIILQPGAAFQSSLQGLTVWWNIVFPGLLPFLVLFELIAAFGVAHAFSALLHPIMSRLLKLPGEASLALVLGWMGGYPAGAEAVASLRKRSLVTKQQGQRLLALAHMPNPLLILVVIGAGFVHQPILGSMIGAAVWLSALFLLLILSLFSREHLIPDGITSASAAAARRLSLLQRAAEALRLGREQDGRTFGKVLGDAITASVQKLLMIGGYIIFAAVLAKLSEPLLAPLLSNTGLDFIGPAFFEAHLGAYAAAVWDSPGSGSITNAAAIAAVLAWSGLSGILQTGYSITGTDLKLFPFICLRLVHAVLAFVFMLLLWKPMTALLRLFLPPSAWPAFTSGDSSAPAFEKLSMAALKAGDLPLLWQYSLAGSSFLLLAALVLMAALLPYRRKRRTL